MTTKIDAPDLSVSSRRIQSYEFKRTIPAQSQRPVLVAQNADNAEEVKPGSDEAYAIKVFNDESMPFEKRLGAMEMLGRSPKKEVVAALCAFVASYGIVKRSSFCQLAKEYFPKIVDDAESLWKELTDNGYIGPDGQVTEKFNAVKKWEDMELSFDLKMPRFAEGALSPEYKAERIFNALRNKKYSDYLKRLEGVFSALIASGYINGEGVLLSKIKLCDRVTFVNGFDPKDDKKKPLLNIEQRRMVYDILLRAAFGHSGGQNDELCAKAITALGQIGDTSAVPYLIDRVDSRRRVTNDACVYEQAAYALGRLADKRAVPVLIEMLKDADYHHYNSYKIGFHYPEAVALGQIKDERAVPYLIEAFNKYSISKMEHMTARLDIARALSRIGNRQAIEFLRGLIGGQNYGPISMDAFGEEGLGSYNTTLWRALIKAGYIDAKGVIQKKFDGNKERYMAETNEMSGGEKKGTFTVLKKMTFVNEFAAAVALAESVHDKAAISVLASVPAGMDAEVRKIAQEALSQYGNSDDAMSKLADTMLNDPSFEVSKLSAEKILLQHADGAGAKIGDDVLAMANLYKLIGEKNLEGAIKAGGAFLQVLMKYWGTADLPADYLKEHIISGRPLQSDERGLDDVLTRHYRKALAGHWEKRQGRDQFFDKYSEDQFKKIVSGSALSEPSKKILEFLYSVRYKLELDPYMSTDQFTKIMGTDKLAQNVADICIKREVTDGLGVLAGLAPEDVQKILEIATGAYFDNDLDGDVRCNIKEARDTLIMSELTRHSVIIKLLAHEGRLRLPDNLIVEHRTYIVGHYESDGYYKINMSGNSILTDEDVPKLKELLNSGFAFYRDAAAKMLKEMGK